ncbi:MAG: Veg family protein [Clostridia bacterium]|nr:Veg family protein [Clostridia bacterium]
MKRMNYTVEQARQKIGGIIGKDVIVRRNRGRNRIEHYSGCIQSAYNNIFVIHTIDNHILTCSYCDLLCGEVQIKVR